MKRALTIGAAVGLLTSLGACGGDSPSTSPTAVTSTALLTVTQTSVGLLGLSSSPDHLIRLELPVEFINGSAVPCDVNFVRLQIFDVADDEVERAEVTADDIVALGGTNRIIQGSPVAITLVFNFNTLEIPRASLTAEARDDNGHTVTRSLDNVDVELAPELQEGE
jgi:hypothetical protein